MYPTNKPDTRTLQKQVWRSSSTLAVRVLGGFAVNVLGGILLARLLGPRIWGIYAISLFLLLAYQTLFEKGLVAYLIQKQSPVSSEEIGVSYTIQIGLGLFCLIISVLILPVLAEQWTGYDELGIMIASAGLAGFAYSLRSVPLALLERGMKYFQVGLIEMGDIIAFNVFAIGSVLLGMGIQGLVIGNIARGVISVLIAFGVRESKKPQISWNTHVARCILKFGIPVFGSNALKILASAADTILVSSLAGPQALGFVQVTYTVLNYPAYLAAILTRVSFSALSRIQDQAEELNHLSSVSIALLSRMILPIMAGLAGTAPLWVPWVYGPEWLPVTRTFLVAAIPMAMGHVLLSLTAPLYAKERANEVAIFLIIYDIAYWLSSFFLIPRWGELGSPIALWVSAPFWFVLVRNYVKHCGSLDLRSFASILLTSAFMMVAISLSIELHWAIVVLVLMIGFIVWWLSISGGAFVMNGISLRRILNYAASLWGTEQ